MQVGFTGNVTASATVTSVPDKYYTGGALDQAYHGVSTGITLYVEDGQAPDVLFRAVPLLLDEGDITAYQVSLATPPDGDVQVTVEYSWARGNPHAVQVTPAVLEFSAGESLVWQDVNIALAPTPSYLGDSILLLKHTSASDDPLYDSSNPIGVPKRSFSIPVHDDEDVGVCLASCARYTEYDFFFDFLNGGESPETPYEVLNGKVRPPPIQPSTGIGQLCPRPAQCCSLLRLFSLWVEMPCHFLRPFFLSAPRLFSVFS